MEENNEKGSITVEAALLVPILFFILLSVMYLIFWLHDRVKVQSVANQMVSLHENGLKHPTNKNSGRIAYSRINAYGILFPVLPSDAAKGEKQALEAHVADEMAQVLSQELWISTVKEASVSLEWSQAQVRLSIETALPFQVVPYFQKTGNHYTLERSCRLGNPAEFVRIFDSIHKVLQDVKGYGQIEEKLKGLL